MILKVGDIGAVQAKAYGGGMCRYDLVFCQVNLSFDTRSVQTL